MTSTTITMAEPMEPAKPTTKKAFGAFVTHKRQAAGLTQRDLARRLFVTESAVSKWERGVSYPDISLVAPLAAELGVTESELINASDDHVAHRVEREARFYRRWKAAIFFSTAVAYATALVICFIVNLAVTHTLDWFWVVAASLGVAASLTTLPLIELTHKGWTVLGAFGFSLLALLVLVWALYGGGPWLAITVTAMALAGVIVAGPVALRTVPAPYGPHRMVLALLADTVMLALLLLVVFATQHDMHTLATRALPIAALAVLYAWVPALIGVYLPLAGLFRAALVVAFVSAYTFLLFNPLIAKVTGEHQHNPIDLSRWHDPYINGNVSLLIGCGGLVVAGVLAVVQVFGSRR